MNQNLPQTIKNQKGIIIIVAIFIFVIWGGVVFLEYKINQNNAAKGYVEVEKNICLKLPKNCYATKLKNDLGLYCQSGTSGKIILNPLEKPELINSRDLKNIMIQGEKDLYYLSINIVDDQDSELGNQISCLKN